MNKFDGKDVLVIYDSANANYQEHLQVWISKMAAANITTLDTLTGNPGVGGPDFDDTTGTDELYDYIDLTYADGTFDYVVITCAIADTGGVTIPQYDTIALLWSKLKASAQGTALSTGTAQAAGSDATHTELEHTDVVTEDYYNTCLIVTDGAVSGLAQQKLVLNQAAATWICEVGGAAQTATDGDGYETYALENIFISQDPSLLIANAYKYWVKATIATDSVLLWDYIHSDDTDYKTGGLVNTPPKFVNNVGNWLFQTAGMANDMTAATPICDGAGTTDELTDTGAFTGLDLAGKYVYIVAGTGIGQYAEIVSNTDNVLTVQNIGMVGRTGLHDAWFIDLVGASSVYRVVDNKARCFADMFSQFYIKAMLDNQDDGGQAYVAQQLLDVDLSMRDSSKFGSGEAPRQNLDYLGTFLDVELGKKADQDKKDKMNVMEVGAGILMEILNTIAFT